MGVKINLRRYLIPRVGVENCRVGCENILPSDEWAAKKEIRKKSLCGSPPGVMMADTLSFNAKIGVVDF